MSKDRENPSTKDDKHKTQHTPGSPSPASEEESGCRCKEAKGKNFGDFIRIMIDDLSFWKKR